jgi:hypothetical protein
MTIVKMETTEETPVQDKPPTSDEVFERLHKKFVKLRLKAEEDKKAAELADCFAHFNTYTKNFENNMFNAKLYGRELPMKEVLLEAKYDVMAGLEEFALVEYFRSKYPYSSVTVTDKSISSKCVHIVLLDDDRDKFLLKRGIKVEERKIPEYYFVSDT